MRRAGLIVVLLVALVGFSNPAMADDPVSVNPVEQRLLARLQQVLADTKVSENVKKAALNDFFSGVFQAEFVSRRLPAQGYAPVVPAAYIKTAPSPSGRTSLRDATSGVVKDVTQFVREVVSACRADFRTSKTCDLYLDSGGHFSPAPSPFPSIGPTIGSPVPTSPGPIEDLTPAPAQPPDVAQANFDTDRDRIGMMQVSSPKPAMIPSCAPLSNLCAVLRSPDPSVLRIPAPTSSSIPLMAKMAGSPISFGMLTVSTSIEPPLLVLPTSADPTPSGLAQANASITFTAGGVLSNSIFAQIIPQNSPIPVLQASAAINAPKGASPSPAPLANVALSAAAGTDTIFSQTFPIANPLANYDALANRSRNFNVCPQNHETGQPYLVAYPIVPSGGTLTIDVTIWCPLTAGYETNLTWKGDEFYVLAAPYFSVGVGGDISAEGFAGLADVGGSAVINVAEGQMRVAGFADTLYDYDDVLTPRCVTLAGAYAFGNYSIGGGDLYAHIGLAGYTINIHLLTIQPQFSQNFETDGVPSFAASFCSRS